MEEGPVDRRWAEEDPVALDFWETIDDDMEADDEDLEAMDE